ncbi:MAG: transcription termination/antitermination protein NusA, partial [Clostridia bacterium]|nr:transcription termination/antitermination protein NusA [Clostridia bacterium]
MENGLFDVLMEICAEKGLSPDVLIDALEAALVAAYRKNFNSAQNVKVEIDKEKGGVKVYAQKTVSETVENEQEQISLDEAREISGTYELGDIVNIAVTPKNFGRIRAM